ncbi:MAG: PD-(D/E)XK nuclease family protein [Candidatus Woesearchaeota archaeon]
MKLNTVSNSKLSCFEQCPLKFKFNYIDHIETEIEETVEAFLGSRVHEALEKLYKDLKFLKLNSLQELLAFYNEEWKKSWNDGIVIVRSEYDSENYRKMGEKYISDYYNRYKPFNDSRTVGLETQSFVEIGGYKMHVRIDRLAVTPDGTYEVHDYKTSNSLPTQDDLDNDRQLAVYAYGVKKMYPDAVKIKLVWHFLAFDREMCSERSDEQLEQLKKEVLSVIKQIEACADFPAKESALCDWCVYQFLCPKFKHLHEVEDKPAEEFLSDDGVKLVNMYSALSAEVKEKEERLEQMKNALVAFAKRKGVEVVYGSDVKASVKVYPHLGFPKKEDACREDFFNAVKTIGLWDRLAVVDVYELAKMINNREIDDELAKLLERFVNKGEIVRIALRRK